MTSSAQIWNLARRIYAVLFSGFILLPLAVILIVSFTGDFYVKFPPSSFGIRWYLAGLKNPDFTGGFIFSVVIASVVAILDLGILGVCSALVLNRPDCPGRNAIIGLLTMPLALPHIVSAIALLQFVAMLAVPSSPGALLAGHLLITIPYVLRLTLTSLKGLDREMQRASYSLGGSEWQTFRLVVLPTIAPGVAAGIVFAFLISFDEVTISIFTALPGRTTLPAQIFAIASQGSDPVVTAVSGTMVFFSAGLVLVVEKYVGVLRLISS